VEHAQAEAALQKESAKIQAEKTKLEAMQGHGRQDSVEAATKRAGRRTSVVKLADGKQLFQIDMSGGRASAGPKGTNDKEVKKADAPEPSDLAGLASLVGKKGSVAWGDKTFDKAARLLSEEQTEREKEKAKIKEQEAKIADLQSKLATLEAKEGSKTCVIS
jgi:hypothetical protein